MVFFLCDGCNESLKKNKVDAHASRCRSCYTVSCVDCSQRFEGDDYKMHTTCISEAEKYEKSLYDPSKHKKKGDGGPTKKMNAQELWMDVILSLECPSTHPHLKNVLVQVQEYDNVPRKQSKFMNFLKNSIHGPARNNTKIHDELWNLLSAKLAKQTEATTQVQPARHEKMDEIKTDNDEPSDQSNSKRKIDEQESKQGAAKVPKSESYPWKKSIQKILKKAVKCTMNKKELIKQVTAQAMAINEKTWDKKSAKRQCKVVLKQETCFVEREGEMIQYLNVKSE